MQPSYVFLIVFAVLLYLLLRPAQVKEPYGYASLNTYQGDCGSLGGSSELPSASTPIDLQLASPDQFLHPEVPIWVQKPKLGQTQGIPDIRGNLKISYDASQPLVRSGMFDGQHLLTANADDKIRHLTGGSGTPAPNTHYSLA